MNTPSKRQYQFLKLRKVFRKGFFAVSATSFHSSLLVCLSKRKPLDLAALPRWVTLPLPCGCYSVFKEPLFFYAPSAVAASSS